MKPFALSLSLVTATLVAVPAETFAQTPPPSDPPQHHEGKHHKGAKARLHFLTEKLGLDANQQAQIKEIFKKYRPQIKALRAKGRENLTEADKVALRDLRKAGAAEMRAVLTPVQQEKLKELRHDWRPGTANPAVH